MAVGTDLAYAAITKTAGGFLHGAMHLRRRQDLRDPGMVQLDVDAHQRSGVAILEGRPHGLAERASVNQHVGRADGQAEEAVDAAHPLRVALGQVVVGRDDVHALARDRVQVGGQHGGQRLALTGAHLGDVAHVEGGPTHDLHVEVPLADRAARRLADRGEGLRQDVVEGLPVREPLPEGVGLGPQLGVGELLEAIKSRGVPVSIVTGRSWNTTELILSDALATDLGAAPGDEVILFHGNTPTTWTVAGIAQDTYLSGTRRGDASGLETTGLVMPLVSAQELTGQPGMLSAIAVSNADGISPSSSIATCRTRACAAWMRRSYCSHTADW